MTEQHRFKTSGSRVSYWLLLCFALPIALWVHHVARSQSQRQAPAANLNQPAPQTKLLAPSNGTNLLSATYIPGTKFIIASAGEGIASIYDTTTSKEIHHYTGPGFIFENIALSADGHTALSTGFKSNVHLWDLATGKDIRTLPLTDTPGISVALSPDGARAAIGYNNSIRMWTLSNGATDTPLPIQSSAHRIFFTDGGRSLAWVQEDAKVCRWNLQPKSAPSCKEVKMNDIVAHVTSSKDGKQLLIAGHHTLILWDVASASALHTWNTGSPDMDAIALSPDGGSALWVGSTPTIHLWNLKTGRQITSIKSSCSTVASVAFSDDGALALFGCDDGKLTLLTLK